MLHTHCCENLTSYNGNFCLESASIWYFLPHHIYPLVHKLWEIWATPAIWCPIKSISFCYYTAASCCTPLISEYHWLKCLTLNISLKQTLWPLVYKQTILNKTFLKVISILKVRSLPLSCMYAWAHACTHAQTQNRTQHKQWPTTME